jgi:hypothetical protein
LEACLREKVRQDESRFPTPAPGSAMDSNNGRAGGPQQAAAAAEPSAALSHGGAMADSMATAQKGDDRISIMAHGSRSVTLELGFRF